MRNLIIGVVAAAALLAAPGVAAAATADPPWTPVSNPLRSPDGPDGSVILPAGKFCVFAADVAVVANNELRQVRTLADGTTIMRLKGRLVLSFKNDTTGKAVERNVGGPSATTISPDGTSATFQGEGPHWLAFGPQSRANTGEPGLVFTKGQVTVKWAGITVQAFSLNGTQENGCALLA